MQVVMKKEELLAVLKKNRTEHVAFFEEATKGYLEAVQKGIDQVKTTFETSKVLDTSPLSLVKPVSYEKEYDEAIEMISMTQEELISLPQGEFRQYVLDKWGWMRSFGLSNSAYLGESSTQALNSKIG